MSGAAVGPVCVPRLSLSTLFLHHRGEGGGGVHVGVAEVTSGTLTLMSAAAVL